jgi:gluconolactonase
MPGIGFAPDGKRVYVTDTGIALGFYGRNLSSPASVYSFDVNQDGTLQNRKTFAYVASFIPDGKPLAMHPNDIPTNYLRCPY